MPWQDRLIEKFKALGYEREPYKRTIEFWIQGDKKLHYRAQTFVRIFRFEENSVHVDFISFNDIHGLAHHSNYEIRENFLEGQAQPVYSYDFSNYDHCPTDPAHTNRSYETLEKRLVQGIEDNYRMPTFPPGRICSICKRAEVNAFWTTCEHELYCFNCTERRQVCPTCGVDGRAKLFRIKTLQ